MSALELRPAVRAYAEAMEMKLRKHDDWPGWKNCDPRDLMQDLIVHLGKFAAAPNDTFLLGSAADIGNFAMMICDVCGALSPEPTKPRGEDRTTGERWSLECWYEGDEMVFASGQRIPNPMTTANQIDDDAPTDGAAREGER